MPTPLGLDGLRGVYERYCDHEARCLLHLIPRDGLRQLSREAKRAGAAAARPQEEAEQPARSAADPMARLVQLARSLLPLPPYHVWLQSYLGERATYLTYLGIASAPERAEPVLVEVRSMPGHWAAELHLCRREEGWRGFIQFTRAESGQSHRTSDIFRGQEPQSIRERFREYDSGTLEAFLRSVLP